MLHRSKHLLSWSALFAALALAGRVSEHDCASCGGVWSEVYEQAKRSVVTVECLLPKDEGYQEVLSGVAVDKGVIVTVGLRPAGRSPVLCVRDSSGVTHAATWVGLDRDTGIAVLTTEPDAVPPIPLATTAPRIGQPILVVGNPYGLRLSAKPGAIAGLNRMIKLGGRVQSGLVQLSAPVHPGDNGAPVCNCRGEMVALIRSGLSIAGPDGSYAQADDIAFATPATLVRQAIDRVLRSGPNDLAIQVDQAYFGIVPTTTTTADPEGLRVLKVTPRSPAAEAGLRAGDVITNVGGHRVRTPADLAAVLEKHPPGSLVEVRFRRGSEWHTVRVVLGRRRRPAGPTAAPRFSPKPDRLRHLEQEVNRLREEIRRLRQALRAGQGAES